jgi:hypothetical protein
MMRVWRVRASLAAAITACCLGGRIGWAQEDPGMNVLFADVAFAAAPASTRPAEIAAPLTLEPAPVADQSPRPLGSDAAAAPPAPNAGDPAAALPSELSLKPDLDLDRSVESTQSILSACACGCGIFEVGTSSMLPEGQGGTFYLEFDYQNQNQNWSGSSKAPAADNPDKAIRTFFVMAGLQYMVDRNWGFQIEIPYDYRHFETTGGATGNEIVSLNWGAQGDIRIEGLYTGFFPDMSAGVNFGFKLPTGNFKHNDAYGDIDRDSEIGTGSTDALLGGFYRHGITADNSWTWFGQLNMDLPIFTQDSYRPGFEFDAAVGVYYSGISIGRVLIIPVGQILASVRTIDSGANAAHPVASGYQRLLLSPGVEFHIHPFMIYGDVEIPVYQYMNGDQLVAPALFKLIVSYSF